MALTFWQQQSLVSHLHEVYFKNRLYYRLSLPPVEVDNPYGVCAVFITPLTIMIASDQRILADSEDFVGYLMSAVSDLLSLVSVISSFVAVAGYIPEAALLCAIRAGGSLLYLIGNLITNIPIAKYTYLRAKTQGRLPFVSCHDRRWLTHPQATIAIRWPDSE